MRREKGKKNTMYTLIGVLTLLITITGATFAYFTATAQGGENDITGNLATIKFNVLVEKKTNIDEIKGGLIPMTNSMVQRSLIANASVADKGICVDDNSNAVCQIYKITVVNTGSASMFVDGYVTLSGGSGVPTDDSSSPTTMRWAQAFCTENETSGSLTSCTTAGQATVRQTNTSGFVWDALGSNNASQHDLSEIKSNFGGENGVTGSAVILGNNYPAIKMNYIRTSKHAPNSNDYTEMDDVTSALVYNQLLDANDNNSSNNTGDSNSSYTDTQVYYIVVWLSETGTNQSVGSPQANTAVSEIDFFNGKVVFITAQGHEITSTFSGYSRVKPNTTTS